MPYTEGAHDSPVDTKDRLVRVGTKYQTTPDTVADGDNVYLAVDSQGRLILVGPSSSGSPATGAPLLLGGEMDNGSPLAADEGDIRAFRTSSFGYQLVAITDDDENIGDGANQPKYAHSSGDSRRALAVAETGLAPDALYDIGRYASNSGPGLGAKNVAPIGGDITLRASAVIGEASGTSTAVDSLGWVKGFNAHLDVTVAPSGGSPTLDVYLQTQLASGDWQDIAHFTQGTGVTAEIVDWGPTSGNFSGIGAEGAAITYDRFFAEQDGALAATTIRVMNLGDSMRVKWVFAAGGSTGDFTFAVTTTLHS